MADSTRPARRRARLVRQDRGISGEPGERLRRIRAIISRRMETLTDIRDCAVAVFSYWQSYVTGGGITALAVLYEKVADRTLPRWTYLVLFLVVFVLMSFFLAWRDEHRLARQLDDRARQQQAADEYSPLIDKGRKIAVTWVSAVKMTDGPAISTQRAASFEWLKDVRSRLERDFGPAVGTRFNLGIPGGGPLGLSEPSEHQARVAELERLIREMREGSLHLRVPDMQSKGRR